MDCEKSLSLSQVGLTVRQPDSKSGRRRFESFAWGMKTFTHPRDEQIRFLKEAHRYLHNTRGELKGVTSWAKNYVKKFDRMGIAKNLAYRRNTTVAAILAEWDESVVYGNQVHEGFEKLLTTGEVDPLVESELESITTIAELLELEPVRAEWVIYSDEIDKASAIDGVFKNPKGEIVIVDFKTYKDMTFEGYNGQTMFPPLDHLPDAKYWMTSLQISIYADWLKKFYEISVADTHYIFHVNRKVATYHPAFDLSDEVQKITRALRGSQPIKDESDN